MPQSNNPNPYASPHADQQLPEAIPSRAQAQSIVHWTLVILAVCVSINIWASFYWTSSSPLPDDIRLGLMVANGMFFSLIFVALWFFALRVIELLGRAFHFVLGGSVSREDWLASLHQSLWPMVPAALIGGALWVVWLVLFHWADHPGGFALDVVFQIAGHVLGAWVYGNVFWHWYLLRREQSSIAAA